MAFMTHEKHGATITNDVAGHEKNGWKVSTPEEWIAGKRDEVVIDEQDQTEHEPMPKKRGRPFKVAPYAAE